MDIDRIGFDGDRLYGSIPESYWPDLLCNVGLRYASDLSLLGQTKNGKKSIGFGRNGTRAASNGRGNTSGKRLLSVD